MLNFDAFNIYSNLLINNEVPLYESKLIDIKADNLDTHHIDLKSSKPDVETLIIKIVNSLLSDIVNSFDQLHESSNVKIKKSGVFKNSKKIKFGLKNKVKFFNLLLPPFIAICSLILFSSTFVYFYNPVEEKEKIDLINPK